MMTEQQKEYTEFELEAQKWIDETDTFQFSLMELLTMFAVHCKVKNFNISGVGVPTGEQLIDIHSYVGAVNGNCTECGLPEGCHEL